MIPDNSYKSRRTPLGRLPLAILALFCMVMTHLAVKAQVDTNFFYTNSYPMNEEYWPLDNGTDYHLEPVTSISTIAGVEWKVSGFAFERIGQNEQIIGLMGGPRGYPTTPYLQTIDNINEPVSGILIKNSVSLMQYWDDFVRTISLTISPNEDMSDGTVIIADKPTDGGQTQDIVFRIGNPLPNMYYRIDFELLGNESKAGWYKLTELRFALPNSTVGMPDFSYSENSEANEYTVNLTAPDGWELHVMWGKYNSADDPLGNCFDESSTNGMELSGPMRETDIIKDPSPTWENPVGSQFTKTFDTSDMTQYYVLRAKSRDVDIKHQSNEIVKFISHEGVVTGIESVVVDMADADTREELWFNMQGVRVASPRSPGVYIHVSDGKARKIAL